MRWTVLSQAFSYRLQSLVQEDFRVHTDINFLYTDAVVWGGQHTIIIPITTKFTFSDVSFSSLHCGSRLIQQFFKAFTTHDWKVICCWVFLYEVKALWMYSGSGVGGGGAVSPPWHSQKILCLIIRPVALIVRPHFLSGAQQSIHH